MESKELEDLFDDIRQTCGDCGHPRCLSIIKSAKTSVTAEVERARLEGAQAENERWTRVLQNLQLTWETMLKDAPETARQGLVCVDFMREKYRESVQPQPQKDIQPNPTKPFKKGF